MDLTAEQIAELAPDPKAFQTARGLAQPGKWQQTGRSPHAVWGCCQGSALYQTAVDLSPVAFKCSCPSRKLPCKHALGLLLLATGPSVAVADPPEWVVAWLAKRQSTRQARAGPKPDSPAVADPGAQARRAQKRESRVTAGLEQFQRWLDDLVGSGIAGLESRSAEFGEQAARLVDAQAPGLATRVRKLADLPGQGPDWPERLLTRLGRLSLAVHVFLSGLPDGDPLDDDLRALIGWNLDQTELDRRGTRVVDRWLCLGQTEEEEDRLRLQRTWLWGARTGKTALIVQFAPNRQPFAHTMLPGTAWEGGVLFYPSAYPQRARLVDTDAPPTAVLDLPAGLPSIETLLQEAAAALSQQPWLERVGCILDGVVPCFDGHPTIRDDAGNVLPLAGGPPWRLLALSGGGPLSLIGEWDGERWLPLAAWADGSLQTL